MDETGPAAKRIKLDAAEEKHAEKKDLLNLPKETLLEALGYLTRKQLFAVQRANRHLYQTIDSNVHRLPLLPMYRLSLEYYADCIIAHRQRRQGMHERSMIIRESSLVPYLRNTAVTRQLELDFDKSRKGSISKLEPAHLENILQDLAEVQRINPNCWQKAECYLDFVPPKKLPFLLTNVLFCKGILLVGDLAKYDVELPDLLGFPTVRKCNSLYFSRKLPAFVDELFEWCHAGQTERLLTCVVEVDEAKDAYERLKKRFEEATSPAAYKVTILSPYPSTGHVRKWTANEKLVNLQTNERIHLRRNKGFVVKALRTAR